VVGFNSRGNDHIAGFKKIKGVRLVALCDVDSKVLEKGRADLAKDGIQVETYTDVRKLLESGEIDAVSTATPNHWHALLATWACQAGKDGYVEKPVSHNVWEGRQIVAAARKYGRIVQTGTQCRSNPGLREAIAWLHEGNLTRSRFVMHKALKFTFMFGQKRQNQPAISISQTHIFTYPTRVFGGSIDTL
jgi:predicted dehydrogenase